MAIDTAAVRTAIKSAPKGRTKDVEGVRFEHFIPDGVGEGDIETRGRRGEGVGNGAFAGKDDVERVGRFWEWREKFETCGFDCGIEHFHEKCK